MNRPRVRLRTLLTVIAVCALVLAFVTQTWKARLREQRQRAELAEAVARALQYQAEVALQQVESERLKAQMQPPEDESAQKDPQPAPKLSTDPP